MSYSGIVSDDAMVSDVRVEGRLYGFLVNAAQLGENHKGWLDDYVIPILVNGGSVNVVGEASRTGSAQLNQALSQRRASTVVEYLRSQTNRRVLFSTSTLLQRSQSDGIGERGAAAIGQDDETEDALFRAVTVTAGSISHARAHQPTPVPMLPRRVVSRRWRVVTSSSPSGESGRRGAAGEALARVAEQIYRANTRGGSDERLYGKYPANFAVIRVHLLFEVTQVHRVTGNSVVTVTTIRYDWGPRTPTVHLIRHTVHRPHGGSEQTTFRQNAYPRNQIWREVHSPTATVF